jgi:hypothetical protein
MKICLVILLTFVCALFSQPARAAETIDLVTQGKSNYSILLEYDAPKSVKLAAEELQNYLQKISGAKLPIVSTSTEPVIALGANTLLKDAKLSPAKISPDGFRIVSCDQNLFIYGQDTYEKQLNPINGFSMGTLFGTYAFLEDVLCVRWIMPGKAGEIINKNADIQIASIDIQEAPSFLWRRIPYIANKRYDVIRWELRNRINVKAYRLSLIHQHAWQYVVPSTLFEEHPDWFAEINGKRMKASGDRYKICTSNPEVIEYYANWLIDYFEKHPQQKSQSLSPTDSAGYCECAKCKALDEGDCYRGRASKTKRILTFYNEVAKRVSIKYPNKIVCGYIYADYMWPPIEKMKLESNLFLVVAPNFNYGYTHFRPDVRKDWHKIMKQWSEMSPNISYYDLTLLIQDTGAPCVLGRDIFKSIFPSLKKYGITKGIYMYGDSAWGHSAAYNWLLAKMYWNANRDVDATVSEFFRVAYGNSAGIYIEKLYGLLDLKMAEFYQTHGNARYSLSNDLFKGVYGVNLPAIENLYKSALAANATPEQKERLEMLGDNLKIMYQTMNGLGLTNPDRNSCFDVGNKKIVKIRQKYRGTAVLGPERKATELLKSLPTLSLHP